jgi:hypothetical protein
MPNFWDKLHAANSAFVLAELKIRQIKANNPRDNKAYGKWLEKRNKAWRMTFTLIGGYHMRPIRSKPLPYPLF